MELIILISESARKDQALQLDGDIILQALPTMEMQYSKLVRIRLTMTENIHQDKKQKRTTLNSIILDLE